MMDESGSNPSLEKDQLSSSHSPSESVPGKHQILIAEDSKNDLFLIQEALRSAQVDADVRVVRDGDSAIKFLDSADAQESAPCPALVLLDLNLPKKNGDEVLRYLRQSKRCRDARVIIVSSSDQPRDRSAVAALNVDGYFKKPSEFGEFMKLGALVAALLKQ